MYRNIVVVLQGKPSDDFVVDYAVDLAQAYRAEITLLRVITVMADGPRGLGKQFQTELGSSGWRRKQNAIQDLSKLQAILLSKGLPVETTIVVGDRSQADEIVDFAEQGSYDLIAMASDGRSWLRRLLSGRPSDGVHRKARVPVLLINDGMRRQRVASKKVEPQNSLMSSLGETGI